MKRKLILTFCVTFLFGCNDSVQEMENTTNSITVTEARYNTIDSENQYEIDLVYPVIDGNLNWDILNKINNTIAEEFNTFSNQKEFIEAHQDLPLHFNSKNPDWRGTLQNSYGISQCDSILHIWFSFNQYFLGAAHGFSNNYSLRFNLNTGGKLNVSDFFITNPPSRAKIKSIINTHLPDNECWGIESDSNILPILENFIFTPDSIYLLIDDYALCPYAFGVNLLSFPKEKFNGLLKNPNLDNCREISAIHAEAEIATH